MKMTRSLINDLDPSGGYFDWDLMCR